MLPPSTEQSALYWKSNCVPAHHVLLLRTLLPTSSTADVWAGSDVANAGSKTNGRAYFWGIYSREEPQRRREKKLQLIWNQVTSVSWQVADLDWDMWRQSCDLPQASPGHLPPPCALLGELRTLFEGTNPSSPPPSQCPSTSQWECRQVSLHWQKLQRPEKCLPQSCWGFPGFPRPLSPLRCPCQGWTPSTTGWQDALDWDRRTPPYCWVRPSSREKTSSLVDSHQFVQMNFNVFSLSVIQPTSFPQRACRRTEGGVPPSRDAIFPFTRRHKALLLSLETRKHSSPSPTMIVGILRCVLNTWDRVRGLGAINSVKSQLSQSESV